MTFSFQRGTAVKKAATTEAFATPELAFATATSCTTEKGAPVSDYISLQVISLKMHIIVIRVANM
jgi:hypothetical protein